jgi:uncharacterized LabA/DUF88 family protein
MHIILNEHIEKLKNVVKGKMGIFIDAANLEQSVRDMWVNPKDIPDELKSYSINQLQWSVDYEKIKNFFQSIGKVEIIRFYSADFQTESHRKFMYFLKKRLKFSLNTKPLKKYDDHTEEKPHRKANFDVEIGVDATFYMNKFDTFILFSGDCDFEYLLKFMRGNGKIALVFSRSGHVAKELPPAASHYFDIIDFRSEILRINLIKAKNLAN